MAWKRQKTGISVCETVDVDVDVDLDEFSGAQLLQELIDRDILSEAEAEAIHKRHTAREEKRPTILADPDSNELEEARDYIKVGQKHEALIHLERFLGREWIGRLT